MYMNKMLSIGKVENGFVVECCVPIKPKKQKEATETVEAYPGSSDKRFIAKDASEVAALIDKLMPMLDGEYTNEQEFDTAFDKAAE